MSNYENIEYILKKRQDNIDNKKWWWDGLTDEEYKTYNRYYIKKLRENPEKKEAEREHVNVVVLYQGLIIPSTRKQQNMMK